MNNSYNQSPAKEAAKLRVISEINTIRDSLSVANLFLGESVSAVMGFLKEIENKKKEI
ncbi:hypothetical protein GVN16_16085 [Emticicia sp. CRIBPO]|uniref:hypothetical protein n=1 Tax=Emticicia sp. CRIBPO TaxID=2683258 RepID=UPI001411B30E|nr:hypothetical protein [Emticicia sp. CRIBPO]NBA87294.1 hypothetical protein [Emticicia sp. CRIBPO]